ncbi:MAG: efflux transporter outer membrane subunit [Planctomycetales bacterium]|nr:efflux transporter outer membrane subunit [Planctomycetales bacterium]
MKSIQTSVLLCALALVAGCRVGPDYRAPAVPLHRHWIQPAHYGINTNESPPVEWWTSLGDPVLDQLVLDSLSENLEARAALARIGEARALRGATRGEFFPKFFGVGNYDRRKISSNGTPFFTTTTNPFDSYQIGFDSSWEIDIWGKIRRSVEAANAELQIASEDYFGVVLTLIAEVGRNYVDVRVAQTRLAIAESNRHIQEQTLQMVESRHAAGLVSDLDVAQARENLFRTTATIPPLGVNLVTAKNALCVLRGLTPGALDVVLDADGPIPDPSGSVAVGFPAELLRRRPDVRRAENTIVAENARIGVETADLYPQFTLAGDIGVRTTDLANLFTYESLELNVGPAFRWNILNFGRIRNRIAAQQQRREQAVLKYQNTVLSAYREAENALVAYDQTQQRRDALREAVSAAKQSVLLSGSQYRRGLISFQTVLDSQRQLLENEDQLALTAGNVSASYIALYKSLGGGWEVYPVALAHRAPLPSKMRLSPPTSPEAVPAPPPFSATK